MAKLFRSAAAGVGFAAAVHAVPYALTLGAYDPIRLAVFRKRFPDLYGVGRAGHMALTFDDGPDRQGTPAILDALDEYGWKATFFMVGELVRRNPDVAREVVARGHEVAAHGYTHASFMRMHVLAATEEIERARDAIESVTGQTVTRFRPPFGTLSAAAMVAARRCVLQTTLWTAWGRDWQADTTPVRIVANITTGIIDGGTLLLHDSDSTSSANSWRRTVASLPLLAELVAHDGLDVGPLRDHGAPPGSSVTRSVRSDV